MKFYESQYGSIIVAKLPETCQHGFYYLMLFNEELSDIPTGPGEPTKPSALLNTSNRLYNNDREDEYGHDLPGSIDDLTSIITFSPKNWAYNNYAVTKAYNYQFQDSFVDGDKAILPPISGEYTIKSLELKTDLWAITDGIAYASNFTYGGVTMLRVDNEQNNYTMMNMLSEACNINMDNQIDYHYCGVIEADKDTTIVLHLPEGFKSSNDSYIALGALWLDYQYFTNEM